MIPEHEQDRIKPRVLVLKLPPRLVTMCVRMAQRVQGRSLSRWCEEVLGAASGYRDDNTEKNEHN